MLNVVTGAGPETNGLPVGAGDQLGICMMRPGQETPGQMVTIDQCTCHNGLGPGHGERVKDSFSEFLTTIIRIDILRMTMSFG